MFTKCADTILTSIWNIPSGVATLIAGLFVVIAAAIAWLGVQRQIRSTQQIEGTKIRLSQEIEAAKVRLDLYNRRFAIYESIFDFYNVLLEWKGTDEQRAVQTQFFRAYQESAFLFSKESGIEAALKMVQDGSASVIGFKEHGEDYKVGGVQFYLEQYQKSSNVLIRDFDEALAKIKPEMAKYLNFHTVEGWAANFRSD